MKTRRMPCIVLCLGLIVTALLGCTHDSHSPTAAVSSLQKGSGQLTDDTADSDLSSSSYSSETIVIAAIGDSITYGKGSSGGGYPPILEQKLQAAGYNVVVLNEGISGERSPETDERFLEVIAGVDVALIMIGMNDTIVPDDDYQVINFIEAMMDKAVISKTIPLVSTVTPSDSANDYYWVNAGITYLNEQIIAAVAKRSPDVYLVDCYSAILANGGSSLFSDEIHFTDAGYDVIADEWMRVLTKEKILDNIEH
ncbi:hypothetical protein CSA56_01430 [candidate division KSB3 bacterium]|uniref:SGNH hydrolase-type esterase domain-containing protein n=1 Tax=candidate division KSB3 bacterium TaxID=2044937 RepID=A0A2G6KM28_9BACT|nr:MAG: hypothetical protein CSA56_01430 [candidate division KSB3 bacterium]